MEQSTVTKQRIFTEIVKSPHGKLTDYIEVGKKAIESEGLFFQHLIAWDRVNGQIRDSKVALPCLGIAFEKDAELAENSFAHLARLNPREFHKGYRFLREMRPQGKGLKIDRFVASYLHEKEMDRGWDHLAVQHHKALKSLYADARVRPQTNAERIRAVLFGEDEKGNKVPLPKGSIFEAVRTLKQIPSAEAAATIMKMKIPFLIALGALEEKAKDIDLLLALIGQMSPTELTTNVKMLEKLGMKNNPALRGAFDKAMEKAATSKQNTLKTSQAVEAVEDEGLKEKLRGLQAKQIAAAGGPDGDWLVLADKSGSMSTAIEIARHVASSLVGFVKGKVWLVFFDTNPMTVDVSGLAFDQIQKATAHIRADGGTSIGVGLNRMLLEKTALDGIAIVSDGGENQPPFFRDVYKKYAQFVGKDVPVYFYDVYGDTHFISGMASAGIEMQTFRVNKMDYYSIPNLVQTMRSNPYSLVDEILAVPLLELSDVFKKTAEPVGV